MARKLLILASREPIPDRLLVRSTPSPVGRLPIRIDYSDYRDVAGLMMPFRWTTTWLDGRSNFELSEVQPNVEIDAARFARPAPPNPY